MQLASHTEFHDYIKNRERALALRQSLWIGQDDASHHDHSTIGGALSRAARTWPDEEVVAFVHQPAIGETRWTFAELDAQSTALAKGLLDRGYKAGERIAIWCPNHPNWILLQYAIAKAGMVLVAINPLYRERELAYALEASDVVAVFHGDDVGETSPGSMLDRVAPGLPLLRGRFNLSRDLPAIAVAGASEIRLPDTAPGDLCMIQYTSGTTGVPKAAWLSHGGITAIAARTYARWGFGQGDRVCHGFPMFHVGGSGSSTPGSLIVGATTLPIYIFNAGQALDILERERCTGFIGVASMFAAMIEHESFAVRDLSSLKRMVVGGASVPPAFLSRCETAFGVPMLNGYGQTESCGVSASVRPDDEAEKKTGTSGLALQGVSLKVVDPAGQVLPCGMPGELCVDGPGKMIGYGDDAATQLAFDRDGWLKTGDIATMDEQGYITIVGRLKEMVIRGGENLYPAEIEALLIEHPDIAEAAVFGLPDERYGEELCAVLRPWNAQHAEPEGIRDWCFDRVSRWKVPRYVAFVDEMPTTPSGKIMKHELLPKMAAHFGVPIERATEQTDEL